MSTVPLVKERRPTPAAEGGGRMREHQPTLTGEVKPVRARARRPVLTMLSGPSVGALWPVRGELSIGRGDDCELRLEEPTVSWTHARLIERDGEVTLEDLGSTNGTFIGNARVGAAQLLGDRAIVRLGPRVTFRLDHMDSIEENALRQVYESAMVDALTGVHNRRYLEQRTHAELSYAVRNGTPLSVLLVDIDHFKLVNDRCGHGVGDAVLRVVASSMRRVIRPEDVLGRYGGEEFVIVARGSNARNATILAERIRQRIQRLPMPAELDLAGLTVSIGVASLDHEHPFDSADAIVTAADSAMYSAKRMGRNRVVSA